MKWYSIELEVTFYGKSFETVQATDKEEAKLIAIKKTEKNLNVSSKMIFVTQTKEINP